MTTINPAALMVMRHGLQPGKSAPPPSATGNTSTGSVSSSKDGDGTFSLTMSKVGGQKTVEKNVSFANGTTRSSERTVTINQDGSKTITKTNANGKTSTIQESEVRNDDGTISLAKQVTKADGSVTQVSGTITKTDGETDRSLTLTNAQGQTETVDSQTTQTGNITMHSRTGTGYNGNPIDNSSTWTTYA
jgi:hypothetical protein